MTGLCQTELNNEMLHHRFVINNAGSSAQGSRFSEICGEKRGWHLKHRHFLVVEGIFLFPVFLRRNEFLKFLGGVQRFWRLFCKRKATGESNAYKQQNGKSSMQPTQNPFSSSKSCVCTDVIQLCHLVID